MVDSPFWSRLRSARLFRVLVIYLAASWTVLQVVGLFIETMDLPRWTMPWALILLAISLVVVLATAWVQSHPSMPQREAADEVPSDWELDVSEIKESIASGRLPHLNWARALAGGAAAFLLLFGFAGLYVVIQDRGRSFRPLEARADEAAPGIAVLPFTVRGGEDLAVLHEGMVDLLSPLLDGAGGYRTIAPATVFARWREHVSGEGQPELPAALEIARQTGALYALIGSAVSIGDGMRVAAGIYEVESGERMSQVQVEGSPDDVLRLVDLLGVEVLRETLQAEGQLPEIDLAAITTSSPRALRAYLEGEVHFRHFEVAAAREAYTRAVETDSSFALAHYRLAQVHSWSGRGSRLQGHHLDRSARLANRLPRREALLVRAERSEMLRSVDALDELRQAVRERPDDGEIWYLLGETLIHVPGAMATAEEIEAVFETAVELDPMNGRYLVHYTEFAWTLRTDSVEAARRLEMYERATSTGNPVARGFRLALDLAFGGTAAQDDALARLASEDDDVVTGMGLEKTLIHPSYSIGSDVARIQYERGGSSFMPFVVATYHGKFRELLGSADARGPPERAADLYTASSLGLPIPPELLEEAIGAVEIEKVTRFWEATCPGLYAADLGRWIDHESVITELRRRAALANGTGDSLRWARKAEALRAYGLWKRDGAEAVLPLLDDPTVFDPLWEEQWWARGRIFMELGRYRETVPVFQTHYHNRPSAAHPLAQRNLGEAYEALGEYDRARDAYEYFVEYWRDADPELQPMVAETREAIARLTRLQRQ